MSQPSGSTAADLPNNATSIQRPAAAAADIPDFQGNDRLLFGIVLGVLTFWLFAQTTLNIAPDMGTSLGLPATTMNIAVAITALFSGIFIVFMGGIADRVGRMRILRIGFCLSIAGSLLVALAPTGTLAASALVVGRALQGLSAACIMPASLALLKTYWHGAGRQRAISLWSIGSWGGSGLCALFGGLVTQNFGWRAIFLTSVVVAVLGLLMIRGTPENRANVPLDAKTDRFGIFSFMVTMIALQVVVTQGSRLGWGSVETLSIAAVAVVFGAIFLRHELRTEGPFIDFRLFRNSTYTGATISNFMLNGVAGTLIVTMQLVQIGGKLTAQQAGMLTIGFAVTIIGFIRVGEKLLQRFGSRKPMLWGCMITGLSILLLGMTHVSLENYKILVIAGFALQGIGLAFYATPSTDAALSALPENQAGAGAGIYKMASSLGGAFGVAISAAIFTALRADTGAPLLDGVMAFEGGREIAVREAASLALCFNLVMVVVAAISIMLTIPRGKARS
ncbi:MFS transporter [Cupriavidus agavae]|uniref:DHA2 family multidrug resistance protein-like MFS transporter n=1 Tax=Cupriavidus agavae TaxID=1001822 RepID=A0A4Q7S8E1_9BURK|nr:MFS transporter [Cupriavidus agavae]RZT42028.1 DHA2 family multidrug resistance protein-like MFS transporter [Cupriavidus agavae]